MTGKYSDYGVDEWNPRYKDTWNPALSTVEQLKFCMEGRRKYPKDEYLQRAEIRLNRIRKREEDDERMKEALRGL